MVGRNDYEAEKEARERRLMAYTEAIQKRTQEKSSQIIKELVDAYGHFLRPAGPHFPDSLGHIKRTAQ